MSSQGANTTTLTNGYAFDPRSTRDSSDVTRTLRERLTVLEAYVIDDTPRKTTHPSSMKYGNGYRLSLLYGLYKCGVCEGNVFGLNGVPSVS